MKLYLKGDRCYSDKCALERRDRPPGQHGHLRSKFSDYGRQLREKQKVKRIYGMLENQFRIYYRNAEKQKGITGHNLLILCERRFDNTVYRLGFSNSRNEARQLIRHNHFLINGKKVNIPSYMIKAGDVVEVKQKSQKIDRIRSATEAVARRGVPDWLDVEPEKYKGSVKSLPIRDHITIPIDEKHIVALYSR